MQSHIHPCLSIMNSFIHPLPIHSFSHSPIRRCIHPFIHSSIHPFIHSPSRSTCITQCPRRTRKSTSPLLDSNSPNKSSASRCSTWQIPGLSTSSTLSRRRNCLRVTKSTLSTRLYIINQHTHPIPISTHYPCQHTLSLSTHTIPINQHPSDHDDCTLLYTRPMVVPSPSWMLSAAACWRGGGSRTGCNSPSKPKKTYR